MTPKEKAAFAVDESKCIHCGRCVAVCTGMVLHPDADGIPRMDDFKLLANAHGLGSVIMSYPSDVLRELAPEAREMLGIPESHYMKLIVGFGYPEIPYARGTQKGGHKVHRWTDISKGQLPLL